MKRPADKLLSIAVGGLTPLSTCDWPGQLVAVVFCQGCPWRCAYCHNTHLLDSRRATPIAWQDVVAFLRRRQGLLDGVVFSGGEPLAQRGLVDAARSVRELGFRVGLHTGGAYPRRLAEVLPLLDWVGLDVKAPFSTYASITGADGSGAAAFASAKLTIESGVAYELRTTVHPRLLSPEAIELVAEELAGLGARRYALQEFRGNGCADATLLDHDASFLSASYAARISPQFEHFELRFVAGEAHRFQCYAPARQS